MSWQGNLIKAGIHSNGTHARMHSGADVSQGQFATKDFLKKLTVTTDSTAGVITYTAAQLLGGLILRDPQGNRNDVSPTALLMVAAVEGAKVGDSFRFIIRNTAGGSETITMTAGTGFTLSGTMTIAQNNSKEFLVRLDTVTSGSEACTMYSLGTIVH